LSVYFYQSPSASMSWRVRRGRDCYENSAGIFPNHFSLITSISLLYVLHDAIRNIGSDRTWFGHVTVPRHTPDHDELSTAEKEKGSTFSAQPVNHLGPALSNSGQTRARPRPDLGPARLLTVAIAQTLYYLDWEPSYVGDFD
jgi:hypothetical protein